MTTPTEPSPWSYESEAVGYQPAGQPVLDAYEPAAVPAGRRRRTPVLIAVAVVVALILGGAAYAGARLWYGSGAQPEDAAPSTVVAFARLDLSPGLGQKLEVNNLLGKFPRDGRTDSVDELKARIFEAFDISAEAYRAHVQPWFAERIGVGAWLDGNDRPYGLIVLGSRDDAKARAGLAQLKGEHEAGRFAFVVRGGHAFVAAGERDAEAAVQAAVTDADRETLAESAAFRRGADWLGGAQTGIAWADFDRVRDAMDAVTERIIGGGEGRPLLPGMFGRPLGSDLKGQLILGLRATGNGAEIRFRGFGMGAAAQGFEARSRVDALPGDSAIAGAFRAGDLAAGLPEGMFTAPDLDEVTPDELRKKLSPDELAEMLREMREAGRRTAAVGTAVSALTGSTVSVAVSGLDGDRPELFAAAEVTSADKATALTGALTVFGDDVTVTATGTRVELTTKGYQAGGGTLGGQPLYREALAGAPDGAAVVAYVDIQRLVAAGASVSDKDRRELAPLKAIGMAIGVEDADAVGLIRIVVH